MTPAQEMFQRRLAGLRQVRRNRSEGIDDSDSGGGLLGMLAGAASGANGPTSVPLDAEQGPAMGGGLLHKGPEAPAPAAGRGITAPGKTHFFIKGRGPTIDFGPIFKPRSTGADPMQGDPFKATEGVGGFFRRLLGDNSDELNAEWQKARMEREMQLSDKMSERVAKAEELAAAQGFTQDENLRQRQFGAAESAADRASREKMQMSAREHEKTMFDLQNEANFLRDAAQFNYGLGLGEQRGRYGLAEAEARGLFSGLLRGDGTRGSGITKAPVGEPFRETPDGPWKVWETDDKTGELKLRVVGQTDGPGGTGDPDENAREYVRTRTAEAKAADKAAAEDPGREGSFFGGLIDAFVPSVRNAENPLTSIYTDPFKDFMEGMKTYNEAGNLERLAKIKQADLARKRSLAK